MIESMDYSGDDWFIAQWPDGTWIDWEDRWMMSHQSDDYEKLKVLAFDESYTPTKTERVT